MEPKIPVRILSKLLLSHAIIAAASAVLAGTWSVLLSAMQIDKLDVLAVVFCWAFISVFASVVVTGKALRDLHLLYLFPTEVPEVRGRIVLEETQS